MRTLALGFRRRGWEVLVISMGVPDAYVEELRAAGVDVRVLGQRLPAPTPLQLARLVRWLRGWRPAVIHAHMWRANVLARLIRPLLRPCVLVSTAHNTVEGRAPARGAGAVDRAYRLTDRLGDVTTNVSRVGVRRYAEVGAAPADRLRHVANGIELDRYAPDPERRAAAARGELGITAGGLVFLAIGRLHAQKDYPALLRAMAAMERRASVLLVAGTGPQEGELRELVSRLGLDGRVRLLGLRTDVPDLLRAADVYVMSSAWEGLPIVLLEAAAAALPIVATDVGGNHEIVEAGVSGALVPPGDSAALAAALDRMAAMGSGERAALGAAGRALVARQYDIEVVLDRWEQLYGDLLRERAARTMRRRGP